MHKQNKEFSILVSECGVLSAHPLNGMCPTYVTLTKWPFNIINPKSAEEILRWPLKLKLNRTYFHLIMEPHLRITPAVVVVSSCRLVILSGSGV